MKRVIVTVVMMLATLVFVQAQLQPIKPEIPLFKPQMLKEEDILGRYGSAWKIYWDGFEGTLVLLKGGKGYIQDASNNKYDLTYVILKNPQDNVAGMTGPGYTGKASSLGHRIVFLVDFHKTSNNTQDDQRFDGYIFTQSIKDPTKRAMAGITIFDNIPFGFYATYWMDVTG